MQAFMSRPPPEAAQRTSHSGASIAQGSAAQGAAAASAGAASACPERSAAPPGLLEPCLQRCYQQQAAGGQQGEAGEPGRAAHAPAAARPQCTTCRVDYKCRGDLPWRTS